MKISIAFLVARMTVKAKKVNQDRNTLEIVKPKYEIVETTIQLYQVNILALTQIL